MTSVTGVVLAGGQGSRMGGVDKGLQPFRGKPMVAHAIERLAAQVDEVLINANRNPEAYAQFGHRVIADEIEGFAGPLAGFERGLAHAKGDLVVTVPCDSPFLPADLVARLRSALEAGQAQLAVAKTGEQAHPVFSLMRRDVLPSLQQFLSSGQRKIDRWYAALEVVEVPFDDEPDAFLNINTREELASLDPRCTPPEGKTMATLTITQASCADDYDPNSMPVAKARAFIHQFLTPVAGVLRVPVRSALGRVLAEDVLSPVDVPAHRNSAMDGWAMRGADLKADGEATLQEIGASFAGRPFAGRVGAGQCVRIMTGGVVPEGADTVVMQERAKASGKSVAFAAGQQTGQNVREAGEDLEAGSVALKKGRIVRPVELGLIASLGIGEVAVYRPLRVAFFSTGDELKSVGTALGEGEIYDSNRYTIHGMLTRLGCEALDMGVVRDDPQLLERAFNEAAANADVVITSGGVSVGEADFVKGMLGELGEVVFWKIAMKPGRPLAYGKIGAAHFFGLPGNPVSVMVTFYQFVRDALLVLGGAHPVEPVPTFTATCSARLKKAPGRTEFQRGVLTRQADGTLTVKPTGEQGSGILKSMSDANCFIILGDHTGNVEPGTPVEVQLLEGLV